MKTPCHTRSFIKRSHVRTLLLGALGVLLLGAGGCAMAPFAVTTTASLFMPQSASLAMTGTRGALSTAQLAADERDMNTIMRDNMLTLKAKSTLLTDRSASDVQVYAYNGDIFAVGVVDDQAQRDHVILTLQAVKGVDEVKGVLRLRDLEDPKARLSDNHLENTARLALGRYVLHKNSGVEISAVQGELCLVGVVGTYAEALDLIQYVESTSGVRVMSLLAIRDEYATGKHQNNKRYLLTPSTQSAPATAQLAAAEPQLLPDPPVSVRKLQATPSPELSAASNKVRVRLGERLQALAKGEASPAAKAELLALARQVTTDRDLSIADRLSVAAAQATNPQARLKIQSLLALY
jgi:osmotically-inducible protein OsmY